jgi:hypothetical protein
MSAHAFRVHVCDGAERARQPAVAYNWAPKAQGCDSRDTGCPARLRVRCGYAEPAPAPAAAASPGTRTLGAGLAGGTTLSTILPVFALDSMYSCAACASARGYTRSTTGLDVGGGWWGVCVCGWGGGGEEKSHMAADLGTGPDKGRRAHAQPTATRQRTHLNDPSTNAWTEWCANSLLS